MGGNSREKMIFSDKPTQLTKNLGQYSHDCVREFSNGFPLEPISKHEKNKQPITVLEIGNHFSVTLLDIFHSF